MLIKHPVPLKQEAQRFTLLLRTRAEGVHRFCHLRRRFQLEVDLEALLVAEGDADLLGCNGCVCCWVGVGVPISVTCVGGVVGCVVEIVDSGRSWRALVFCVGLVWIRHLGASVGFACVLCWKGTGFCLKVAERRV